MADDDVRVPAGWYPDPLGLPQLRWWDNHAWTEHTSDARQPMMAQETVVSARLAYKDDDEDDRDEQAFDDLPTRRQRREQEQPQEDEGRGAAFVEPDLPNADALLSLEAPSKQERDLEQPSPAARIASTGLPENAPTSAPYRLDTQFDDLTGGTGGTGGTTKPWAFDDPDGADEPYGYSGDPSGHGYYAPHDQYGYRGDPYSRRGDTPKYGTPGQPVSAQQAPYAESQNHPASYSFWADPYAQRPNPYAQPAEQQPQQQQPTAPGFGQQQSAASGFGQPGMPGFGQAAAGANFAQPTFAPGIGQPPPGSAVPMYTPMFSPDSAPDLQPVAYPTRRGTLTPVSLPVSTGPIWAMALLPVIMLVLGLLFLLSGGAGKLSPIFAGVIVVGPYLLAIGLAIADRTALQRLGYEHTASWSWAILGAPAYLIVRLASVVRETGRGFGPLLTWVAMALLSVVAVIAVPGIVLALAPATFSAEAEASILSDAAAQQVGGLTVSCPEVPPLLIQQSMKCEAISDTQNFPITVSLQRSNGWIDWRVDDWGQVRNEQVTTADPSGGPDPASPDPTTSQAVNVQEGGRVTDQATRVVAAGWYEDPASAAQVRWWNGVAWTDHTREKPAAAPQQTTATPDFGADQVRELERQFLYAGDAAAQAAADTGPDGKRGRRPRRSIEADRARIYGAHTTTGSVWLIALSPLLAVVVAIAVGYFYFYVSPQPLVLAVGAIPILLGLLWAITDSRKLRDWGNEAASGTWALLGPLVYLIARRIKVKGSGPLAAFLVVSALTIAVPVTAYALDLTRPVSAALEIQSTVRADYVGSGQAVSVTCPPFAEATTVGAVYSCDATMADGQVRQIIVSIDTAEGKFSYAFALD